MENKKIFKNIFILIISIILVLIISLIVYDRITIKNQYYLEEKKLEIPIFVYHNIINDDSKVEYDYMQTKESTFESQIKGLKLAGYNFITYEDLEKYKEGQKKLYKKSCIVTFDDGYDGVYENAYLICKKYNIPFTVFIITDNMDTEGYITWAQAQEMKESGLVTIASHSINHPEFTSLSVKEALENVNKSYEIIEEKLGNEKTKIFTYPYGLYNEEQVQELAKEGYIQNLTDNRINKSNNLNLFGLHRCYLLNDSIFEIIAKIIYRSIRYN